MELSTKKTQKYTKYFAETIYVGEYIDLKKVQENVKKYTYLNRDHPLAIKILKDQFIALTKFGAVTFWNVPEKLRREFLKEIKPFIKSKKDHYSYDEDTRVWIGGAIDKVTFERVYLYHFGVDKIKIISYVLSQSVALERYEDEIEQSLSELGGIVDNLKSKGKSLLSEKELLKQIGKVLSVKQTAIAHLSLFDKPEEIWESPDLENLYNRMDAEYEIRSRFDVLDKKINYLSDVSQMFVNFLAEKRSALLEVIVIALIVFEIVLFLPYLKDTITFLKNLF